MSTSRLLSLEAENFMGYEYFRIDFDDTNIISLKGYNSAGKTTVIRALGVINSDMWSMKQSKFIRYGQNMFRITENFSDGVKIIREKYASGKSAYIMYKDGKEIFSTIQNGVYTAFKGVPDTIKRYLNLIDDTKINLHLRRGRDDLLLVDTTGRDNYLFLSSALKAEEISTASAMLKSDRLNVKSDISAIQNEIEGYRNLVTKDKVITPNLVGYLEDVDSELDKNESKKQKLESIHSLIEEYTKIKPSIKLDKVNTSKLSQLMGIVKIVKGYNDIKVTTRLDLINRERLLGLRGIIKSFEDYGKHQTMPILDKVDLSRQSKLRNINKTLKELVEIESNVNKNKKKVDEYKTAINKIEKWLKQNNVQVFRCKNCGELQAVGEEHHH